MVGSPPDVDYPVRVTERPGGFELRIQELLLSVRAPDLQEAYDELLERKQEIIAWASKIDALDELPPPDLPSILRPETPRMAGPFRRGAAILSRLATALKQSR